MQESQEKEETDDEGKDKKDLESSDSEEDEDEDSARNSRFKSERQNIVSLSTKAGRNRRDIPETLGEWQWDWEESQ